MVLVAWAGSGVSLRSWALQALVAGLLGSALALLGGCVYREAGPPEAHFKTFASKPPQGDTVTVCHAYGCKAQTAVTFTQADIAELFVVTTTVPRADTPREERRAIANAIGWMERRVAPAAGTASDRPSMDFRGSGDRSQQDCVDEATNTTSYLLVLDRHGLIRHHAVERPFAKDDFGKWTHWAALIKEKQSGELFAIDSSASVNGENLTVQSAASTFPTHRPRRSPRKPRVTPSPMTCWRASATKEARGDEPLGAETQRPGTKLKAQDCRWKAETISMPAPARTRSRH